STLFPYTPLFRSLLLRSEQVDRAHRQSGLDPEEGPDAAIAATELHVDQPGRHRAHLGAAVALEAVPDQAELAEPPAELQRELRPLPVVVDHRKHLVLDEAARPGQVVELRAGQVP